MNKLSGQCYLSNNACLPWQGTSSLPVPSAWNTFPLALHIAGSFSPMKPQLQCHRAILSRPLLYPWPLLSHRAMCACFWTCVIVAYILSSHLLVSLLGSATGMWTLWEAVPGLLGGSPLCPEHIEQTSSRKVVNNLLLHEPIYHCVSERNCWQTWRFICEFPCK